MEPIFHPFCPRFRTLPTFVTLSLRNFKASARCIRLRPQIAGFGSQRMCPSCGLITSHAKEFCLECKKSFPAVYLLVKRCNGAKVHRHSDSILASDPARDCWPYKENPFCPSVREEEILRPLHRRSRSRRRSDVLSPRLGSRPRWRLVYRIMFGHWKN
jgi:hypothetical protein